MNIWWSSKWLEIIQTDNVLFHSLERAIKMFLWMAERSFPVFISGKSHVVAWRWIPSTQHIRSAQSSTSCIVSDTHMDAPPALSDMTALTAVSGSLRRTQPPWLNGQATYKHICSFNQSRVDFIMRFKLELKGCFCLSFSSAAAFDVA